MHSTTDTMSPDRQIKPRPDGNKDYSTTMALPVDDELRLDSSQELSGRSVDPMKLMMLLRLTFGIDQYEISVSYF